MGVERGKGHIAWTAVPTYLIALTTPNALNVTAWLTDLREKGKIKPDRSKAMADQVVKSMMATSARLENLGCTNSATIKPKEGLIGQSPFLKALLNIDASHI